MNTLQLDYDEGIILENEDVYWASRDDLELTNFTLTNKNFYCTYEKDNGFFKKSTSEMCVLSLSDIKIINGQPLVQQVKYEGSWCIQLQFRQGVEYFSFSSSPKKVIPQWIAEINRLLVDSPEQSIEQTVEAKKKSSVFSGLGGMTANLRNVADTAAQAVASTVKQASETINHHSAATEEPTYTPAPEAISTLKEQQYQGAKFCSNCGTPINVGAKFCHGCGAPIGASNVPTSPPITQTTPPPVPMTAEQEQQPKRVERRQQEFVGTVLKCPNFGEIIVPSSQSDSAERKTQYNGTIHKCPNCGETIDAFVINCPSCGHELRDSTATNSVQRLYWELNRATTTEQKVLMIRNYPIPNAKEDIIEFMIQASTNIKGESDKTIFEAWVAKYEQAYQKAKIALQSDPAFSQIEELYEKTEKTIAKGKITHTTASAGNLVVRFFKAMPNPFVALLVIWLGFCIVSAIVRESYVFIIIAVVAFAGYLIYEKIKNNKNDDKSQEV